MRIKRIEVIGFKSFCDRAVVQIADSVTGVVGPNGCGKSNIVDAIRWCMGEQSAKHLRGKAMEDVIFAGSESRGPSSMAEVSLTFDDVGFSHEALELARHSDVAEAERAMDGLGGDDLVAPEVSDAGDATGAVVDAAVAVAVAEAAVATIEAAPEGDPQTTGVWTDAEGNRILSPVEEATNLLADHPPAIDFARYTEVTITRRLYRDGTSQYFINKTPCRLRDITDFFLGTGIGTKAYAIIEQGRVGQIVSARPQDRRAIIEEAAGITKFKTKKKAAEKKLDQTRQNLMRVSDIVSELDKRMGTLRRQAQKAERYRKYKTELRDIELWKGAHRWLELNGEGQLIAARLRTAQTELADTRAAYETKDAHVVAERAELALEERRLVGLQEQVYEHDNRIRLGDSKHGFQAREADELDTRSSSARTEIDDIAGQRARGAEELATREAELETLAAEVEREAAEVATREAANGEARQMLVNAQGRLDAARAEIGSRKTEIATAEAQLEALGRRRDEATRRLERVLAETEQHAERVRDLERESRRVDGALTALRQTRLDLGDQHESFAARHELLADEVSRSESEVDALRTEAQRRSSRLASLREIQDRYEGFARGTRAVMMGADELTDDPDAIQGLVADVVRAPEQLEVAVEAALGDRLGGVLVREPEVGLAAIGFLKSGGGGRSAFVPLTARSTRGGAVAATSEAASAARATHAAAVAAHETAVAERAAIIAAYEMAVVEHAAAVAAHEMVIAERAAIMAAHETAVAEHTAAVAAHETALAERAAIVAAHETAIAEHGRAFELATAAVMMMDVLPDADMPVVPELPELAALPELIELAALPELPMLPELPQLAALPELPQLPEPAAAPTLELTDAELLAANAGGGIIVEDRTELVAAYAAIGGEGVLGRMVDLVGFSDGYESIGRRLLGGTVVVDDLPRALRLHREGISDRLVTLDGDVVEHDGVVAGGSREAQGAGVLAQKREIRDLEEIVGRLEHDLSEAMARLVTAKTELKQVGKAIEGLRTQQHEGDLAIMGHEKDETRVRADLERYRDRLGHLGTEQLELEERLRTIGEDDTRMRDRRAAAAARIDGLEREQLDHVSEVALHRDRLDDLATVLTEARIRAAQLGEKRAAAEAAALRLQRTDAELATRAQRLTSEIVDAAQRAGDLRADCAAIAAELVELREQREREVAELDIGRGGYERRLGELTEIELVSRELRGRVDGLAREVGQLDVRASQNTINRQVVENQIDERYQLAVTSILHDYHLRAPVDAAADARLTELRDLIERMGTDINLTAIDEFAEVNTRFEFLSAQKTDLERAVDQLQKAIDKINKTSRKLFKDTFTAVNATFKEIFPRLFRGGQAALSLAGGDEVDLLEAGIDIMAQPPGKKNATVEQLSGGEKALTAVALVFSIFLIKPSPFCILDEVDAPLDEANVDRYNEMVREMTDRSQFIVITHNKRTMESADSLYGVTMQEPGVSKLVSVNLSKIGRASSGSGARGIDQSAAQA